MLYVSLVCNSQSRLASKNLPISLPIPFHLKNCFVTGLFKRQSLWFLTLVYRMQFSYLRAILPHLVYFVGNDCLDGRSGIQHNVNMRSNELHRQVFFLFYSPSTLGPMGHMCPAIAMNVVQHVCRWQYVLMSRCWTLYQINHHCFRNLLLDPFPCQSRPHRRGWSRDSSTVVR